MTLLTILKQAAFELGRGAVKGIVELVRGKPEPEPPHPTWKDVEHIRAQERSATSHKVAPKPAPPRPRD